MPRSLFDHPEVRRMRAPIGWRALIWADQTALKRRCLAIIDGLPDVGSEHRKEELDRRLAEVHELVRDAKFTPGASADGLMSLLYAQLEIGNSWIAPRLFSWAIPDWRLRPYSVPALCAIGGAVVMLSLLTSPRFLPLVLVLLVFLAGIAVLGTLLFGLYVSKRSPHLPAAQRLRQQLDTLLETGPAEAAAAKYEEIRVTLRDFAHEPIVRGMTVEAARRVAQSELFRTDKEVLRKVVDDATTVVRTPRATVVQLFAASEALRAAGPALVPIDRDTAFAAAGILEELAARPGFHAWGCRQASRQIRRDLGEPWVE